jgi:uncharacterized protein (TIGR02099 family)
VKTVSRTLQLFIAVLVVVIGLSAASVRVLFPAADRYRGDLEQWLAGIVGQPVAIGSVQAEWRGWGPEFRVNDLRLRDPAQRGKDGGINARFESATVTVDVLASLLGGALRPTHIRMGDISLRVNEAAEAVGPDAGIRQHLIAVLDWLQSQQRLRLDATRVELSDLRVAGKPVTFTNLHLVVRNDGPSHALEVALEIPGARNGAIRASASLDGDPTSLDWSGDIALDVDGLNLATVDAWRYRLGKTEVAGRASLRLTSRWQAGILTQANGDVSVNDLRIAGPGGVLGPLSAEALLDLEGAGGDWQALVLHPGAGFLGLGNPTPLATLRYTVAPGESSSRVSATVAALDIADVVPVLPMTLSVPDAHWQQVLQVAPRGQIRDLAINFVRDAAGIRDVAVAGGFRDVSLRSSGSLPALSGVSGEFHHDALGTRLRLAGGGIRAALPDLYPEPLAGQDLHGEILWSRRARGQRLALSDVGFVTPDVTVRASGALVWEPDDAVPVVDLSLDFSDGNLERLEYFVPTSTFGELTGAWLDQAFPRGRLVAGRVLLHGRPPRELESDTDFSVTVHVDVADATVHYLDGWPSTERVTGSVHIVDRKLVADVSEAYFYGARVRPGRFMVADILADDPVFQWSPRIDGRTEDAMRFLRESPLREDFRSLLDNVQAAGEASLALNLELPIASGVPRLTGTLDVSDNTVSVPSLEKGFTGVAGRMRFDQDGMGGEGVTGDYLGRTVVATVESVAERSGHTRVRLAGSADADYVARHLHNAGLLAGAGVGAMPILTHLDGSAPWNAAIDVIERPAAGEAPVVLRVESTLRGAGVTLPAPFGKPPGTDVAVAVEARFADAAHRQMHLTLGSWASGIFELQAAGKGYRLERGAVRLGGEAAALPDAAEFSLSGHLERVAMSEWSGLLPKSDARAGPDGGLPRRVDLAIDRLEMLGAGFSGVRLQASGSPAGSWHARLSGPDVDGTVTIPAKPLVHPIIANFERLSVTPVAGGGGDAPDPRKLPPVRFTCAQCSYGDMQLRDLEVATSRRADGLSIDSLKVRNDGFRAQADGAWTHDDEKGQRTRLDVRLSSDDLGKFLASMGHDGGATRGGVTDISLAAAWDGPPSNFDLAALEGVLHFRAGKGTLTDVRRGTTGRLFGLLVVPDLPRRLKGDFSDLFEDGFVYKQIEGTFNIEHGNAYTNDLTLDGSLARIDIAGRTGLTDEDYDQLMTVTPKLSESLPLMPIWLVEKAIQRELFNKLFAYQYSITGSWDEPSVTPIVIEKGSPSDRS